ncbi:MAG: ABC transporter ATP-binding protein [Deltaproteobacteria bacterium HGW-Deltaproteobacteria-14]|nr:MAG: ABC transporter ATP-binding protein [Deltaproteobacteria bacterium HGW-Deltaproteobacteria-14]
MSAAVECRALVKRYPDVTAVDGIDLTMAPGECLGVLGPNGAGKTTTVEMIEGLTEPTSGHVAVFGLRWGQGARQDKAIRRMLGVQLQETRLQEKLTVDETVRLFRSFFGSGRGVDDVIALVSLESKRGARVGKLSGGQRQRLALACALVGAPRVLCLDEPTTGLDPQSRRQVWEVVEAFKAEGGTVLLTTHYMEEAARLADRVAILDQGKIIAEDTPDGLIASLGAEQVIDLTCERPVSSFDELPGVISARGEGAGHRLHVTDVAVAMPGLLARVAAEGAGLSALSTHRATLEDVFVHLTGRGLRDG